MTLVQKGGDLTSVFLSHDSKTEYFAYTCVGCGEAARNTYCEPSKSQMLNHRFCFTCNYWRDFEEKHKPETMTIIDGHVYTPGNRTTGEMRGMAGRRFDIEYIEPSIYAGQRVTTFDLWSGSTMPDHIKTKYPDTAKFLGGAHRANVGGTTCWDNTQVRAEPYPLPRTLRAASQTGGGQP